MFVIFLSDTNEVTLCNFVSLLLIFGSDVVRCSLSIVAKIRKNTAYNDFDNMYEHTIGFDKIFMKFN
jgi:hypothetical protein